MQISLLARTVVSATVLAAAATAAWAQDYSVTAVTGQYVAAPTTGTTDILPNISNKDDGIYTITSLPFPVPYFGVNVTSISVCTNGYCFMNASGAHATAYSPTSYPYPQTTTGSSGRDGIVAVCWQDLDGRGSTSKILTWTDGTAPNRRFIVSWINWQHYSNAGSCNFQVQFFEDGTIQTAYTGTWTSNVSTGAAWTYSTGVGIDALTPDTRWVTPSGSSTYTFTGTPLNDWRFAPKITNFTGRVLFDRIVSDASGIGNSVEQNLPLTGLTVELRDASGKAAASAIADANGDFAIRGAALLSTNVGSVVVAAQTPACVVRPTTGGTSTAFTLATGVSFGADRAIGTISIGASNDAAGTGRAPLNIARTVQGVYDWCVTRTTDSIKQIEILYDPSSAAVTSYQPAGTTAAQMRVGASASNPDPWDTAVLRKTYARHVLGSIAANPTTALNASFDGVSDQENAFAEGFGYYLNSIVSGSTQFVDGLSSSSATLINLENPTLVSPKGPDVAGWVGSALYDLIDPANEVFDTFDGTGIVGEQVFRTVDAIKVPVTATAFYTAWGQTKGYDGVPLATLFIRNGLIGDDGDEPNDASSQAFTMTQFGFIRTARVLNLYNEDWYRFTMPQPTNKLTIDVIYDRIKFNTAVGLELKDASGATISTGSLIGTVGNLEAVSGALPSGDYLLRVKHNGNNRLDSYSLQVFSELAFSSPDFAPWTVGRQINLPMNIKGGIPPYTLSVEAPFSVPPGILLDGANLRVKGVPTQAGLFSFILSGKDAANPRNIASGPINFRVNPEFKFKLGEFQAFTYDRDWDRTVPTSGGTAPYTFKIDEGALPHGLIMTAGARLRFAGHPDAPGSFSFKVTGTDTAGSFDTAQSLGVTCVPFGTATLGVANAACGYWFDAVQGSAVSIGIKTTPGQVKRAIRVTMLDADGTTELPATIRAGRGGASVTGFVAPSTGRFYCVIAGEDAGGNTSFEAVGKVTPPKKGGGINGEDNFVPGDQFTVKVGALQGAVLSFSAKPVRSAMVMKAYYLVDPLGQVVTFAPGQVKLKGGALSFTATLDVTGTWKVILGAEPGDQGQFTYAFKLRQPVGGTYTAD